jgi:ABC-type transport system involved in cytochrome c biogenesis permease subunit
MKSILQILSWFVLAGYITGFWYYFQYFRENNRKTARTARILLSVSITLHTVYLVFLAFELGHLPLGSVNQVFTSLAWCAILVYFFLEVRLREMTMGVFFLPVVAALHAFACVTLDIDQPLAPVLTDILFEVHVIILIASYSAFAISFIASIMYLLLSREMQSRSLGIFFERLPSLDFFDKLSNLAVNTGLILISGGIGIGIYMGLNVWEGDWMTDPKFIAAMLSWIIYLSHLLTRRAFGWQGKRAAILSSIGFAWLLFSFLIVNEYFSEFHNFQ